MKTIIINEKVSVAEEFAKTLGVPQTTKNDGFFENEAYIITWARGHLVEMSYPDAYDSKWKKWDIQMLPFLPEKYLYEVKKDCKKQFSVIKKLYHRNDVKQILYAGDSAREGLYIQMLIRQEAGVKNGVDERVVWIDSQTKEEIKRGIREAKPLSEYATKSIAGYMRAKEDYTMGINFSRALSCKYGNWYNDRLQTDKYTPISVGRVMTCVLGMVVAREYAIIHFRPTDYYKISNVLCDEDINISGNWKITEESDYKDSPLLYEQKGFLHEADAIEMINRLPESVQILSNKQKTERKYAPYLFNLSELQAECTKLFKMSPSQTLDIAQTLYEKKLTTYPRTGARVLSSAVAAVIGQNLNGISYYNDETHAQVQKIFDNGWEQHFATTRYVDDKKISDHYAIIPTGTLSGIDKLNPTEKAVYELILQRFVSVFYPPAAYTCYTLQEKAGNETFIATAKVLSDLGYYEVAGIPKADRRPPDTRIFERVNEGDFYSSEYVIEKGQTTAPKRYTTGSMVLAMENAGNLIEDDELRAQIKSCGIGTDATRAAIISKLIDIGYIHVEKKTQVITPTEKGNLVYEIVKRELPDFLSPEMTASWEKGLAKVESGELTGDDFCNVLYSYITKHIQQIREKNNGENYAGETHEYEPTDLCCPLCGGKILHNGKHFKCENYDRENPSGCLFYIGTIFEINLPKDQVEKLLRDGKTDVIEGFQNKKEKKKTSFSAMIACEPETADDGRKRLKLRFEIPKTGLTCPVCGSEIKEGEKSYYCANYKNCTLNGLWKQAFFCRLSIDDIQKLLSGQTIVKFNTYKGHRNKHQIRFDLQEMRYMEVK